jgi:poly(3-hydroxybutyrate) depolymerase
MPSLYLVGTKDSPVRIEGGEIVLPWGKKIQPSVEQTLQKWAKALGATSSPRFVQDKDGNKILRYGQENDPASLTAWYIEGQGHGWPGDRESGLPTRWIGPATNMVNATDVIWEFFRRHRRSDLLRGAHRPPHREQSHRFNG